MTDDDVDDVDVVSIKLDGSVGQDNERLNGRALREQALTAKVQRRSFEST